MARRASRSRRGQTSRRRDPSTSSEATIVVDENDEGWEVDRVVGKKQDQDGNLFYKLKWSDWRGQPTWEPAENCLCPRLIADYEKKLTKKKGTVVNIRSIDAITAAEAVINAGTARRGPNKMITKTRARSVTSISPDSSRCSTPPRNSRNKARRI